jgi:hypothetical protein
MKRTDPKVRNHVETRTSLSEQLNQNVDLLTNYFGQTEDLGSRRIPIGEGDGGAVLF